MDAESTVPVSRAWICGAGRVGQAGPLTRPAVIVQTVVPQQEMYNIKDPGAFLARKMGSDWVASCKHWRAGGASFEDG